MTTEPIATCPVVRAVRLVVTVRPKCYSAAMTDDELRFCE
jgi:hypothetical protein